MAALCCISLPGWHQGFHALGSPSKEAKEAGKKGKEMQAAVEAAVGLTEAQKKFMAETDELLAKARAEVGKLLTPEQMKKLPEPFQTNLKEKEGKKKKAGV